MKFILNQAGMNVREYVGLYLSKEKLCACHKLYEKQKLRQSGMPNSQG